MYGIYKNTFLGILITRHKLFISQTNKTNAMQKQEYIVAFYGGTLAQFQFLKHLEKSRLVDKEHLDHVRTISSEQDLLCIRGSTIPLFVSHETILEYSGSQKIDFLRNALIGRKEIFIPFYTLSGNSFEEERVKHFKLDARSIHPHLPEIKIVHAAFVLSPFEHLLKKPTKRGRLPIAAIA